MAWTWSSEPSDWAIQGTAVFTAASSIFTGAYVWLTYRLMTATSRTAEIAFLETQRSKMEILLPINRNLRAIKDALGTASTSTLDREMPRQAAVLTKALSDLSVHTELSLRLSGELSDLLADVYLEIEASYQLTSRALGHSVSAETKAAIGSQAQRTLAAVDRALSTISGELNRLRNVLA